MEGGLRIFLTSPPDLIMAARGSSTLFVCQSAGAETHPMGLDQGRDEKLCVAEAGASPKSSSPNGRSDGHLRHSKFVGLREDKEARGGCAGGLKTGGKYSLQLVVTVIKATSSCLGYWPFNYLIALWSFRTTEA
jgi:hypothetical protein